MGFVHAFVQSIYNIPWLRSRRHDLGKASAYAILFLLLATIVRDMHYLWIVPRTIDGARQWVETSMPDFTAEVKKGTLTVTGLKQPYTVTFGGGNSDPSSQVVLAVDTSDTSTLRIADVLPDPTANAFLLTQKNLEFYSGAEATSSAETWDAVPEGTVTKANVEQVIKTLSGSVGKFLSAFIILFDFILSTIISVVYLLLVCLIVWVVQHFAKRTWTFREIFTVGLFALTFPTVLQTMMLVTGAYIPFFYSFVLFAYLFSVIFRAPTDAEVAPPPDVV